MRARAAAAAAALAIAAAGIAGCGGGGDSALTRDEFLAQADAVCAAGNARIEAAVPTSGPPGPPSGAAGERFYETIVDETQGIVDGVAALEPPDEMRAGVDAMVADARQAVGRMRATSPERYFALDEDLFASVNRQAAALGLRDCAGDAA